MKGIYSTSQFLGYKKTLKNMDKDKDGKIDFNEFLTLNLQKSLYM